MLRSVGLCLKKNPQERNKELFLLPAQGALAVVSHNLCSSLQCTGQRHPPPPLVQNSGIQEVCLHAGMCAQKGYIAGPG